MITLIEELGEEQALVVGHDWGAPVAWTTALLRPDRCRAVAGLNTPPIPPGGMVPLSITRTEYGEGVYQVCFQQQGVADVEFANASRTPCGASWPAPRAATRSAGSPARWWPGRFGHSLSAVAPQTHGPVALPVRGHWTQQERPAEVNAALLDSLDRIDGSASR